MPNSVSSQIGLAIDRNRLYLALDRRATHEVSLAADAVTSEFFAADRSPPEIVLDLAACELLDSTFAGWMLKLRRRTTEAGGRIVVSRCPRTCRGALDVMGLSQLFAFENVDPPPDMKKMAFKDMDEAAPTAVAFMLAAHEDLANINDRNRVTFAPVAELLRRELGRKSDT